jgi:hypothetical protein
MKLLQLLFILFNLSPVFSIAQKYPFDVQKVIPDRDSMLAIIREPKDDLDLIRAYREMGFAYYESKRICQCGNLEMNSQLSFLPSPSSRLPPPVSLLPPPVSQHTKHNSLTFKAQ